MNIARSAGTVPLCLPPASHSPTISSSTWSIAPGFVALDKGSRPLAVVDVRGVLRPGEQWIGRPALPECGDRHAHASAAPEARPRACSRARLASVLVANVPGPPMILRHAQVLAGCRVVDLRPPAARRKLGNAHAALRRSEAQEIAADGLKPPRTPPPRHRRHTLADHTIDGRQAHAHDLCQLPPPDVALERLTWQRLAARIWMRPHTLNDREKAKAAKQF